MDSKDNLKKALKNLPVHKAPDRVWAKIDLELGHQDGDSPLNASLAKLPVYQPTEQVWENIAQELPGAKPWFKVHRNVWGLAASFALLIGGLFWMNGSSEGKIEYAYSEEVLDERLQFEVLEDDEATFAMIEEICELKSYLCDFSDFNNLRNELAELTEAKEELQFALSDYNTNPELMAELNDIEMERTVVFKRLLAML